MAISYLNTNIGSCKTQAGAHEYMKELRAHLLAVGLDEITVTGAYDASETGDVGQMPETQRQERYKKIYSPYMHFAFSDGRQSSNPLVVSFSTVYGNFFDHEGDYDSGTYYSEIQCYAIRVRISQGIDVDGEPLAATLNTNNTGGTASRGGSYKDYYALADRTGLGSFVRYNGDSLTIFLDYNGIYNTQGGQRGAVQLHIERLTGNDFAVMPLTAGSSSATQRVYYSSGASIYSQTALQSRVAGSLNLYSKGVAVIAPIYAPISDGSLFMLKRVFTVPADIGADKAIFTMDFTGEEKPYLLIKENSMKPHDAGTAWLYEWEQ